jgi:hypothetical protein
LTKSLKKSILSSLKAVKRRVMTFDTHREFPPVKGNRRHHHETRLGAALRIDIDVATYVHVTEPRYFKYLKRLILAN